MEQLKARIRGPNWWWPKIMAKLLIGERKSSFVAGITRGTKNLWEKVAEDAQFHAEAAEQICLFRFCAAADYTSFPYSTKGEIDLLRKVVFCSAISVRLKEN